MQDAAVYGMALFADRAVAFEVADDDADGLRGEQGDAGEIGARQATSIHWSFVKSAGSAALTAARRNVGREPELPL